MSFFGELKRRGVVRVGVAYVAGAWFLVQIADTVVPAYGLPDAWVGILITVLAIGVVPVLVVTWLFELTPEGLRRDTGEAAPPVAHRNLDRVIMILLALGVGYFAVDKFVLGPGRNAELVERIRADALVESYGDRSVAVLPFVNMTGDPEQAYFADGIAEEILNLLAKIRDLRVISRTTSFAYRDDVSTRKVAEELGVTYVLEGSVRQSGNTFRITAQLINGRTDSHVWSETWDRAGDNIFEIQNDLAGSVANALRVQLGRDRAPRYETDSESYALFLRARHVFYGYSANDQDRRVPIRMLRTVLERDPDYVPAMLELFHILSYEAPLGDYTAEQAAALDEEREELLRRALSIAPNDAVANAYMSWHSIARQHDAQAAARYIQRALELDPAELEVLRVAAVMAEILKLDVDRIELLSRTLTRDLLCVNCLMQLAEAYDDIGAHERAREIRQRRIDLAGDEAGNYQMAYSLMDTDPAAALEFFQSRPDDHGADALVPQIELLLKLGRRHEALEVHRRLIEEWGDQAALGIAMGFAQLGDIEAAWDWLHRALARDEEVFVFIYEGEDFPGLRDTLRWKELRRKMGLSEEQLAAVKFKMPDLGPG